MASLYDYMNPTAKKIATSKPSINKYFKPITSGPVYSGPFQNSSKAPTPTKSSSNNKSSSNKKSSKKSSSKKSSSVNTSNGTDALNGQSFLEASKNAMTTPTTPKPSSISPSTGKTTSSSWRRGLSNVLNVVKNTSPIVGGITGGLNNLGFDLTNLLGIPAQAQTVDDYWSEQGMNQRTEDAKRRTNEVLGVNIFNTNDPTISNTPNRTTPRPSDNNNNTPSRTPSRTSNNIWVQPNPYQVPTPNPYQSVSPQSIPDYGNAQPDNATIRRLAGRGIFSTGEFANGGGDYGVQGSFGTGGNTTNPYEDALIALGLKTPTTNAQMSVMPQGFDMQSIMNTTNPVPGLSNENMYTMQEGTPTWNTMQAPLEQGTGNGGYGGGATGGYQQAPVGGGQSGGKQGGSDYDKQIKQQEKYFKQQEKAQKKALEELIKSIKNQYNTSQTEGTSALEKSKQEDLLKLSGLFGFANQDPNSEQRMQYEQRTQGDYASQLKDFLAKIAQGQTQDISGAKQNYQQQVASIAERRAQIINQLMQQQQEQAFKMQQLMARASNNNYNPYGYDPYTQEDPNIFG